MRPRPVEWVLAAYAVLVVGVAAARIPADPAAAWIAAGHALLLVLLLLFQRVEDQGFGAVIREVAPIVLLVGLYGAIDIVNRSGGRTFDAVVQRWEDALFGWQPSRDWWRAAPSEMWSTVLHAAYFAYYVLVPFPIVLFLRRRQPDLARRAVLMIMTAFVLCYTCFLIVPVAGPYYAFERPEGSFVGNAAAQAVYAMLAGGSSFGAAFPSSHVAGAWAAVAAAAVGSTGWGLALAVPAIFLTVGVVYTQMHYAVDVLAGLGVAVLAVCLASRLHAGGIPARRRPPPASADPATPVTAPRTARGD